ncbi:GNAT family N-acetyltransferase [Bacteriovoracaceae bacterium]|nr:GNAT family N-acetyltransferase [Bacteriovoracaceae bacterium]
MKLNFSCIDKSFFKEIFMWRSDEFTIAHNPLTPCTYDEFIKIMEGFTTDFNDLYSGGAMKWAVLREDRLVGIIGISQINQMMKTAEIGYQVCPKYRGQGIGFYMVHNFVKLILDRTDLRKLIAFIADKNIPSCKIVEKVGFHNEGLLRKHFLINEGEVDERIYGLLRSDF